MQTLSETVEIIYQISVLQGTMSLSTSSNQKQSFDKKASVHKCDLNGLSEYYRQITSP